MHPMDLTFLDHASDIIQRDVGRLRGQYRIINQLPESSKTQLVQFLIIYKFQYRYPAYGNSISKEDIDGIQQVSERCCSFRFVHAAFLTRVFSHRMPELNKLPMKICKIQCAVTIAYSYFYNALCFDYVSTLPL